MTYMIRFISYEERASRSGRSRCEIRIVPQGPAAFHFKKLGLRIPGISAFLEKSSNYPKSGYFGTDRSIELKELDSKWGLKYDFTLSDL